MARLERTYTVPLRHGFSQAPAYKRSPRAVRTLRAFIVRHMKSEEVKIGPALNELLWARGLRHPPPRVKVTAVKEDGIVKVELFGHAYPEPAKPAAKKEGLKDRLLGKKEEKMEGKMEEKAPAQIKGAVPAPEIPGAAAQGPGEAPKPAPPKPSPPKAAPNKPAAKPAGKSAAKASAKKPAQSTTPAKSKPAKPAKSKK